MRILHHLTAPPPVVPGTDAVFQEVAALRARFGGDAVNLFPLRRPSRLFPRALYGLHLAGRLRALDAQVDLHHVHYATLYPFPVLRPLTRPVLFTVVAGLAGQPRPSAAALRRIHTTVVSSPRDAATLDAWGVTRYRLIRPGIELGRFSVAPPPPAPFVLLLGSAPWIRRQFATKGFDLVLEAVARRRDLRVVLLWRGLLRRELDDRIARLGIADRVEVLDGRVDVNATLARVHAAAVLAETPRLVKAYPHSLLEALAAGRPVLISRTIPMADHVEARACGVVVDRLSAAAIAAAVDRLVRDYGPLQRAAQAVGARDFTLEALIEAYGQIYAELAR